MKTIYGMVAMICATIWFGSCQNETLDYYPIGKKHLGESYTEYAVNNVITEDTVSRIILNFYPEEVTALPYINYDESTCTFTFHRGQLQNTVSRGITKPTAITWKCNTGKTACGLPSTSSNIPAITCLRQTTAWLYVCAYEVVEP